MNLDSGHDLTVHRPDDLLSPNAEHLAGALMVLGAARLGTMRLIDQPEF